jgi:hypothetical protein
MPASTDIEPQVSGKLLPLEQCVITTPIELLTGVLATTSEARSQPWKEFIEIAADADKARADDFITIHANDGDETGEFHDYATQLG